jgi:phasin family protein
MIKDFEEFQTAGKENLEAAVASATAMTKGFQDIASEVADYSRKSFEDSTAVFEKAVAAKSIDKALEVQTDFAKTAYEAYIGQVTKIGELYVAAAKEAYKPFEGHAAQFAGKTASKKSA